MSWNSEMTTVVSFLHPLLLLMLVVNVNSATTDASDLLMEELSQDPTTTWAVPGMFVFGDSTLDAGTNSLFPSLLQANFQPYGKQYFGKPTGRFTNGRTYADIFANLIGLPYPEPYLKRKGAWSIMQGVNYASAGSGFLRISNAENKVIPFLDQISQFGLTKKLIEKTLKSETLVNELLSRSLFLISCGGNDLVGYLFTQSVPQEEFFDNLLGILNDSLSVLYEAGARKIMILGTGPVGCVPGVLQIAQVTNGECIDSFNVITQAFNAKIEEFVKSLPKTFKHMKAIVGKPFEKYAGFLAPGNPYGFKHGVTACCGYGIYNAEVQCGRPGDLITNPPTNLCENVGEYVFWDYFHPTDKAYGIIAEELWKGNTTYVAPMSLKELISL